MTWLVLSTLLLCSIALAEYLGSGLAYPLAGIGTGMWVLRELRWAKSPSGEGA